MEKILIETEKNQIIITLLADLIEDVALDLKTALKKHIENGAKKITIDIGGVNQMATQGIGAIVFAHRTLSQEGGRLTIINTSAPIHKLFTSMTLDKVLHLC